MNQLDSSQVWSGFRVAKRAKVVERTFEPDSGDKETVFGAVHDGFLQQGIPYLHRRSFQVDESKVLIIDKLEFQGRAKVQRFSSEAFFYLHPSIKITSQNSEKIELHSATHEINIRFIGGKVRVLSSQYYPEFGLSKGNSLLKVSFQNDFLETEITWSKL